jgi:hypothetical protein
MLKVEHHDAKAVYEYFRAADLCFVSSLHDGMNLVAKEFVAARDDERGVLVLSQFTGAARELAEALIVSPYDADQCAAALHIALTMEETEQRDRMRLMRGLVAEYNVFRWAGRMLLDAVAMRRRGRLIDKGEARSAHEARACLSAGRRRLCRLCLLSGCRRHAADQPRRHACKRCVWTAALLDLIGQLVPRQRGRAGAGQWPHRSRTCKSRLGALTHAAGRATWPGATRRGRPSVDARRAARRQVRNQGVVGAPAGSPPPGLMLEDKGLDIGPALPAGAAPGRVCAAHHDRLMQEIGGGLELQRGKRVVEIKPAGIDKGTAVAEYLAESPFRGPPSGVHW